MSSQAFNTGFGFQFSGAGVETVAAKVNRAFLAVYVGDASGSLAPGFLPAQPPDYKPHPGFEKECREILTGSIAEMKAKGVHEGCYVAAWDFSSDYDYVGGLKEVIPFSGIDDIDVNSIPPLKASGGTPTYEAAFNAISAAVAYATKLDEEGVTTDIFIIKPTDGKPEGRQLKAALDVRQLLESVRNSKAEFRPKSICFTVIGLGDRLTEAELRAFASDMGADAYYHFGDLKKGAIGKTVGYFSSSVALSMRTGKSQAIDPNDPNAFTTQ